MEAEKKDLQAQVDILELQGKQLELKTKNYADQSESTHIYTHPQKNMNEIAECIHISTYAALFN